MIIKEFLKELQELIISIQEKIAISVRDHETHSLLENYISCLKDNPYSISNISNAQIDYLLEKLDINHILVKEDEKDIFYEKLDVLRSLAYGRKEGIGFV